MKNCLSSILTVFTMLCVVGCGKKDSPLPATPNTPVKAVLTFPAQNSACTTGTVLSATQSSITFTWNSAANTDSYELTIKNLLSQVTTTQTATTNQVTINLLRDTPYSWFVVSKSNTLAATAQSDTWKFYNAGQGTMSHPPFPADSLTPTYAQNVNAVAGAVNLAWSGTDADNDIVDYDVYFDVTPIPALYKGNVTSMFLNNVTVTHGVTYYWKIVTRDIAGNTSDSGIFQFKVN